FLYIFPMIALWIAEAKKSFFNQLILFVPESGLKTQLLFVIADAANAIFAPAVCFADSLFVQGVTPCVSMRTVVLAYGSPLSVAYVRCSGFPLYFLYSFLFCTHYINIYEC